MLIILRREKYFVVSCEPMTDLRTTLKYEKHIIYALMSHVSFFPLKMH